jgi:hypothetical protein
LFDWPRFWRIGEVFAFGTERACKTQCTVRVILADPFSDGF